MLKHRPFFCSSKLKTSASWLLFTVTQNLPPAQPSDSQIHPYWYFSTLENIRHILWWSFETLLKTSMNSGCKLFAAWCSCIKNLFLLASDQPGVQSSPKPSWQDSRLKLYMRVLSPVEETVFSNFLKGCDDGILHVGLVGFKLCPSSDVQKRTHFGKWICSRAQGNGWQFVLHMWQVFEWLKTAVPVKPIWAVVFTPIHHHPVTYSSKITVFLYECCRVTVNT